MALAGSLQFSPLMGVCRNRESGKQYKYVAGSANQHLRATTFSSCASRQDLWSCSVSMSIHKPMCSLPHRCNVLRCHSFMFFGQNITVPAIKNTTAALTRSCNALQSSQLFTKLVPAIGIIIFALWGLRPLMRMSRNLLLRKSDSSWRKSTTNYIITSYLQPILLWIGAILICRAFDPIVMPTEASQLVKHRLLTFVKSLSTVLAFAYCLSSAIQQVQRYLMETNDPTDTRNLGFQFAGKAVYSAVWIAAFSLFMELLGFSTQKWLTAGGLGTVLLTLAGREIFTNFLSSAMIHATRPFVVNDWIQTKIEGYEVSGFVEHVGWWSPTIIRGEDREAVHIPNHKFTVNIVRNLTQKTHWRIKTHLAISHLDVGKINNIVADMRKVLAKNPQIEQQRLHRRVFLENVDPENQALLILISCFVKTSHFEEYLCVKEAVLLDLLRVIRHHRARLATPIRTIQKVYGDIDVDSLSFSDSIFSRRGPASSRPLLLVEPSPKINGEDNKSGSKSQAPSGKSTGEQKLGPTGQPNPKVDATKPASSKSETSAGDPTASDLKPSGNAPKTPETHEADGKPLSSGPPSSSSSQAKRDEKTSSGGSPSSSVQPKQAEKSSGSEPAKPAPAPGALEENIVLGVALEGSKRTLPIEEGLDPHDPQTLPEGKEQVAARANSSSDNDDKDK